MRHIAVSLPAITVGDTAPPGPLNWLAATFVIPSSRIPLVNAYRAAPAPHAAIGTCERVSRR